METAFAAAQLANRSRIDTPATPEAEATPDGRPSRRSEPCMDAS
ncbi:hypothetical protein [Streptomyces neyagawaensis]|nr:hypothetical protein [Streptomyces neyagawaensis]MDE1681213.1 hypothetical protein [Streptomyces neyagawaensis]